MFDLMRNTKLFTFCDSSTNKDPDLECIREVNSDSSCEVECISLDIMDAVLWKVRSSSAASAL